MIKCLRFCFLMVVFLLVGCNGFSDKIAEDVAGSDVKLREIIEKATADQGEYVDKVVADRLPDFEEIKTPKEMIFLGEGISVIYGNVSPKILFKSIVGGIPVRFDLINSDVDDVFPQRARNARTVGEHLDSISAQLNWHYDFQDGIVVVSDWQDAVIPIASLIGVLTGSISSDPSNLLTVETNPYAEVADIVSEILGVGGASSGDADGVESFSIVDSLTPRFSVSQSANMVYVSAQPNDVKSVQKVLERFNYNVSRRVIIEMTVYDVELDDNEQRSLDINLLKRASNLISLNTAGQALTSDVVTELFNLPGAFSPESVDDALSVGLNFGGNEYSGSLVLAWLDTQGVVINHVQRRFDGLNNRIITLADTVDIEYIKQRSIEREESQSGVQIVSPAVEIENRIVGRTFNILPTVVDDRINIQLFISDKSVLSETPYGDIVLSGTLFRVKNSDRMIPLSLGNGETRLLTYLTSDRQTGRSVDNKLLPVIGDKNRDNSNRLETVIVIKATVAG